jgi:hypothetical protein
LIRKCASAIGDWRTATNFWQRRASAVAFVNLAKKGDENLTRSTTLVLQSSNARLLAPPRFSSAWGFPSAPAPAPTTVGVGLAGSVPVSVASLFGSEFAEAARLERIQGRADILFKRHVNFDPPALEPGESPLPEPPAKDRIHGTGPEEVEGTACAVDVMGPSVPYRLHFTRLRVDESEERRASEMIRGHSLQPTIVHGRYAKLHDSSFPC